ncbi:PREDICTED: uncharacterized protein LOC107191846 [Dufourea novaeangliae]|uniref:28S ribosomal protein S34, mitochondrial n=1 Tax=Dufourea novaeangliae TaxID=178035 RepID=A0A154PPC1_DUFNO|nr:PREDICTED: uncharacterized protein LOC107191846 [Dufourea novaeangliae]KZC13731.1 28S ribosomal protein S34, mitochondrial [Dufourea novaeangliae]
MPIKYIGRKTDFKGKTLWEILGNLKNCGVGRMILRSQFQKYREASYMRILKVAAQPDVSEPGPDNLRKVVALVERTFRGTKNVKPVQIDSVTYKGDYILVPKDQETSYINASEQPTVKICPETMELPPLLRELLIQQAKQAGKPLVDEPKIKIRYCVGPVKFYKVAENQL